MFVCAQSAPLNQEPIVCADIGTAHSAAVTGEGVCPNSERGGHLHFPHLPSACLASDTQLCLSSLLPASGHCYTFGSNQHGQLGTNSCRNSRVPHLVVGLETMKVTVVACGDAFTVAIGAGEAEAPTSWAAAGPGWPLLLLWPRQM